MKTYSVEQVAELLEINQETVRRWIRDKKLRAEQTSKKKGNIISEHELLSFLKKMPKYMHVYNANRVMKKNPMGGVAAVAGIGVASAGIIFDYLNEHKEDDVVDIERIKEFLRITIDKMNNTIEQKKMLIQQTENELYELSEKMNKYRYLLENDKYLISSLDGIFNNQEIDL